MKKMEKMPRDADTHCHGSEGALGDVCVVHSAESTVVHSGTMNKAHCVSL